MNFNDLNIQNSYYDNFHTEDRVFLSPVNPTLMPKPELIGWSDELAEILGIDRNQANHQVLAGNQVYKNMKPFAARYGGHQFGHWAGQLGDGRAITLGEVVTANENFEIQIKGSGLTPYSRQGDGRAVLRSSLREFICSEAMSALRIPTTRALSLSLTGENVVRDILYDGNPQKEKGAVVTRVSPSFLRFGNFEILAAGQKYAELKKLSDYVIQKYYPSALNFKDKYQYAHFLKQVTLKTAELVAEWMRVGFVHGVMNTDNMSILGLTIDYGPYGWVEEFDPDFTPNTTDFSHRRYRFSHQPEIALWNLNCLAQALYPLIEDKDLVVENLNVFQAHYEKCFLNSFSKKLGVHLKQDVSDSQFTSDMFNLLYQSKSDFTLFFRSLSEVDFMENFLDYIQKGSYSSEISLELQKSWSSWVQQYADRMQKIPMNDRIHTMKQNNPSLIFRNYLAQQCIDQADQGNYDLIDSYLKELRNPYRDRDLTFDPMTFKRPEWANNKPGCSALSCSS